jgi:hypothetical protein
MTSTSDSEPDHNIDLSVEDLISQLGDINLNDSSIINLKTTTIDLIPGVIDTNWETDNTGSTSRQPQSPRSQPRGFSKPTKGYAGLVSLNRYKDFTPLYIYILHIRIYIYIYIYYIYIYILHIYIYVYLYTYL